MQTPSIADIKNLPEWLPYREAFSRQMLELGGWSQGQADEYLENRLQNDGFRSWFAHDNPSKEAAPLLIPHDLRKLRGLPWVRLCADICDAIDRRGDEHNAYPDDDPAYDWEAARERVAFAIEEFRNNEKLDR